MKFKKEVKDKTPKETVKKGDKLPSFGEVMAKLVKAPPMPKGK